MHPGLPDLVGFGRRAMTLTPDDIYADTLYQVGAIYAFVRAAIAELHHMKPHGALNTAVAETSDAHAEAIVEATRAFDPALPIIAIAGSELHHAAQQPASPSSPRLSRPRYAPDGSLAKRGTEGAIVHDPRTRPSARSGWRRRGTVEALDGTIVELTPGNAAHRR